MKKLLILLVLILVFSCSNNDENIESSSDCSNPNAELICWTILDDSTDIPIAGAYISFSYGLGWGDHFGGDSTNAGLACFCFRIGESIESGFIRAEGYEQMDLSGINPFDISTIRLISLN